MQRYGTWKYLLIFMILGVGIVYALPNLYSPDPAVQISYNSSSQSPDSNLVKRIQTILDTGDSETVLEKSEDYILVRTQDLTSARTTLRQAGYKFE